MPSEFDRPTESWCTVFVCHGDRSTNRRIESTGTETHWSMPSSSRSCVRPAFVLRSPPADSWPFGDRAAHRKRFRWSLNWRGTLSPGSSFARPTWATCWAARSTRPSARAWCFRRCTGIFPRTTCLWGVFRFSGHCYRLALALSFQSSSVDFENLYPANGKIEWTMRSRKRLVYRVFVQKSWSCKVEFSCKHKFRVEFMQEQTVIIVTTTIKHTDHVTFVYPRMLC